jgi:hypothetical protein
MSFFRDESVGMGRTRSAQVFDGDVDQPGAEGLPFLVGILAIVLHGCLSLLVRPAGRGSALPR